MLRRSSSFEKSKGDSEAKENGSQANDKPQPNPPLVHLNSSSKERDYSAKRNAVVSLFEKYAQLIHASLRPLPTQSGDGTYLESASSASPSSGLLQDLRALGFGDLNTLKDVLMTQGQLVDDKTMLMERVIQVSFNLTLVVYA